MVFVPCHGQRGQVPTDHAWSPLVTQVAQRAPGFLCCPTCLPQLGELCWCFCVQNLSGGLSGSSVGMSVVVTVPRGHAVVSPLAIAGSSQVRGAALTGTPSPPAPHPLSPIG